MKKFICLIFLSCLLQSCVTTSNNDNKQLASEDNIKLGLSYLQSGNTPIAKEKLLLALEEAPQWSVALDAMAYFFEKTGDNKMAQQYYQQAIKVSKHQEGASLNNYGDFLCRHHQPFEAEKLFLQAGALPNYLNSATAYENAGLCALTIPDKNKAKLYFSKALKEEPQRDISTRELKNLDG